MSEVNLPIWSLCPFRSPVEIESLDVNVPLPPRQALGPCLYAGCGLWKITKVIDGKAVEGMCSLRFLGEVMNSVAGSLEKLIQLETTRAISEQPTSSFFKG